MAATIIGIDAHKRSHTPVVLDNDNEILDQFRLVADRRQTDRLLAWAARWPDRVFAIEHVRRLGRLLGSWPWQATRGAISDPRNDRL